MLNIIINAYACSPNWGSEQGMAWNWIVNLSQYCNLYIITEEEYADLIEEAVSKLPQQENLHFYYNPVSKDIRKMCWNQGDWRFYYYYQKWQYRTYQIAKDIIKDNSIDLLHQLNMIGFREPGYLWKIKDIPFVWGPIGGMETMPITYLEGASLKQKLIVHLKNAINAYQTRHSKRVGKALERADVLIAAVKGVKDKIELYHDRKAILINETGCYPQLAEVEDKRGKESFDILWVGKFDFRKQLGMALQTISKIKNLPNLRFHIVGSGSESEKSHYKTLADSLGITDLCEWYGLIPNAEVQAMMRKFDLLLFTSIMEGTPHVVLEAIGNNLPILCLDSCGQAASVNEKIGIKIPVTSLCQSVFDFSEAIKKLYKDRELLHNMSLSCAERQQELSWDSKARQVVDIYEKIINKR